MGFVLKALIIVIFYLPLSLIDLILLILLVVQVSLFAMIHWAISWMLRKCFKHNDNKMFESNVKSVIWKKFEFFESFGYAYDLFLLLDKDNNGCVTSKQILEGFITPRIRSALEEKMKFLDNELNYQGFVELLGSSVEKLDVMIESKLYYLQKINRFP